MEGLRSELRRERGGEGGRGEVRRVSEAGEER